MAFNVPLFIGFVAFAVCCLCISFGMYCYMRATDTGEYDPRAPDRWRGYRSGRSRRVTFQPPTAATTTTTPTTAAAAAATSATTPAATTATTPAADAVTPQLGQPVGSPTMAPAPQACNHEPPCGPLLVPSRPAATPSTPVRVKRAHRASLGHAVTPAASAAAPQDHVQLEQRQAWLVPTPARPPRAPATRRGRRPYRNPWRRHSCHVVPLRRATKTITTTTTKSAALPAAKVAARAASAQPAAVEAGLCATHSLTVELVGRDCSICISLLCLRCEWCQEKPEVDAPCFVTTGTCGTRLRIASPPHRSPAVAINTRSHLPQALHHQVAGALQAVPPR